MGDRASERGKHKRGEAGGLWDKAREWNTMRRRRRTAGRGSTWQHQAHPSAAKPHANILMNTLELTYRFDSLTPIACKHWNGCVRKNCSPVTGCDMTPTQITGQNFETPPPVPLSCTCLSVPSYIQTVASPTYSVCCVCRRFPSAWFQSKSNALLCKVFQPVSTLKH